MKKYITLTAFLVAGSAFAGAEEIAFTEDLTPTTGTASTNANGISAGDIWNHAINSWFGTWEKDSLANQVGFSDSGLTLQIGAVASNNTGGNYAAVKFELDPIVTSATLGFDFVKTSSWGGSIASFSCNYSCTIYGFSSTGNETEIGIWSFDVEQGTASQEISNSPSISLAIAEASTYSAYGLLFHSKETSTLSSGAGMAATISNIKISGTAIPEPSVFGLLAGLGALALVGTRRRRR